MKTYPAYKDSGVAWLGDVPAHWEVRRLKFVTSINPSRAEIKKLSGDLDVSFFPMEAVGYGELYEGQIKHLQDVSGGFTYFRDNDVLIAKITPSFENGKGALASELSNGIGFGTTELHVIRPSDKLDKNFLFYFTYSHEFRHPGEGMMDGTAGQKRIPNDFLIDYRMAIPPLPEQAAIAAYLDRKAAQIDAVIAKKKLLIELLREERMAMISTIVTRGLNPNVSLQDSGISSLGLVPAHWKTVPLKFASPSITVGIVVTPAKYYTNYGVPCLRSLNIRAGEIVDKDLVYISSESNQLMQKSMIYKGDIVSVRTGKPGTSAVVDERFHEANCIDLIIIRRSPIFVSEFLVYFLNSDHAKLQFESLSDGAIQQHFNIETAKNMWIPLPPNDEQKEITEFINKKTSQIDGTIFQHEKQITLLQGYRTTLISAVVTGKVDVREETVP